MPRLIRAVPVLLASCTAGADLTNPTEVEPAVARYPVTIVTPLVLQGLPLQPATHDAGPLVTPCATCHGAEDDSPLPQQAGQVQGPHAGLRLAHGSLQCGACHAQNQRDRLHLADGRTLALLSAMELCAQCHGPQKRDYDHGAHGGMRGYWDLSRGPRERNHCVSCHDPHAPAFGKFAPVAGPRDRFTQQGATHHD